MNAAKITTMPAPPVRMVPCPARCNDGVAYVSDGPWDENVQPVTCEICGGLGYLDSDSEGMSERERETVGLSFTPGVSSLPAILADPDSCPRCLSTELRYIAIESKEPHQELFRDEGWRCTNCGTVIMRQDEPQTSTDILGDLMRSLALAKNLDPAFRLGIALSIPRKPAARIAVEAEKGAA